MLRTVHVVPSILTADRQDFRRQVETINTFTRRVQIDVTDSEFSRYATIDVSNIWWPNNWQTDLHMMVGKPSDYLDIVLKLHPSLCIFHAEVKEDLLPVFEKLKNAGIKTGVALMRRTYPVAVSKYIEAADHALILATELGRQGGQADMMQTEKIPLIRGLKPEIELSWDGGANLSNFRALAHADLDVINVGSAISKAANPAEAYRALVAEIDKNGVVI